MNIAPINNCNYKHPKFESVNRYAKTPEGMIYQTFTLFCRGDLDWKAFTWFLENKYKNVPKVNIFSLACSVGAEPYTLAMSLMEELKEKSDKFFPINASDIDKANIELIHEGKFDITRGELYKINKLTDNKTDIYLKPETFVTGISSIFNVKPILREKVEFKQSDILTELKKAPKSNTVFLIKNVWPYLCGDEKSEIFRELATLDKSCSVVIGEIDAAIDVDLALERYGFTKTQLLNVYEKEY